MRDDMIRSLKDLERIKEDVAAVLAIRYNYWLYAAIPATSISISAISGAVWGRTEARRTAEDLAFHLEARDAVTATFGA